MARKRGPKNRIEKLPKNLLEEINEKLLDPNADLGIVLDFINSHLKKGDYINASSLNRYTESFDKRMKKLQDMKYLINNLPKEFDFDDESKFHSALAGMLSNIMFEYLVVGDLSIKDVGTLSKSLENIMSSMKDREKIKADLRIIVEKEVKQAQVEKLKSAKAGGKLSKKSFDDAMRILGL